MRIGSASPASPARPISVFRRTRTAARSPSNRAVSIFAVVSSPTAWMTAI